MAGPSASSPAGGPSPEVRRRRREFWIILATAIAVVVLVFFETRLPRSPGGGSRVSDGLLIALLDLNLILLVLFVFLVGRNVLKVIFERRRGIMGSRLRARLVGAFVAIALLPATFLFLAAYVFVNNSIERWFESEVESSLEGSLEVANAYYEDLARTSLGFARQMAKRVAAEDLLARGRREALKQFLETQRGEYQLDVVEVHMPNRPPARSRQDSLPTGLGADPGAEVVRGALGGREGTALDQAAAGTADVIRAAAPILVDGRTAGALVVDAFVPQSVVKRRATIEQSFRDYVGLKLQRKPIRTTYTVMLMVVTLVALFSAMWLGFYLARGITVPLQRLAEGARHVAQGDLDQRIAGEGVDEVGTLVTAFNRMTADLKTSRTELESRRRYVETVLANVTAGVVSLDADGRITTMNRAAEVLLDMRAATCVGRSVALVFAADAFADLRQLAAGLRSVGPGHPLHGFAEGNGHGPTVERQLNLGREGREVAVLLTGSRLLDEAGSPRGVVLFLEEVTHLLRVQRMEAWREVARRIAHEIKNPLTPIALAAQRLRRRYAARLGTDGAVFEDCTRTIIQQVEELKTLVNEFSTFARMPAGEHVPHDLNRVVEEALVLFREGHREIDFGFTPTDLPALELDREGVKRAVINILDNAVAACGQRRDAPPGERGRVELRTTHDGPMDVVRLEIADNGAGMTADVKARLFEPYYSTKSDGTGLGLAIVSAIVADHHGFIRVRDNLPRGSRFILEFPVRRQAAQLAAQARAGAWAGA